MADASVGILTCRQARVLAAAPWQMECVISSHSTLASLLSEGHPRELEI